MNEGRFAGATLEGGANRIRNSDGTLLAASVMPGWRSWPAVA